jgi:putative peptide zinc metalloprotease protein
VVIETDGYVEEILAPSGTRVSVGDPLVRLSNQELGFEIRENEAKLREVAAMRQRALLQSQADLQPLQSLVTAVRARSERLREEQQNLTVRAPIDGIWVAPQAQEFVGMWISRGTPLGRMIDDEEFTFVSVVNQRDTSFLFSRDIRRTQIRIAGETEETLEAIGFEGTPVEQSSLPSAALGLAAGGDMQIDVTDEQGLRTTEPFYEVRLQLAGAPEIALLHGRSGMVRFELPNQPLLRQWYRKLRQLLQSRYQL